MRTSGGTPYNQAELLLAKHGLKDRAKVISGMNLPMVVDVVLSDMDVCSTDALGSGANARMGLCALTWKRRQPDQMMNSGERGGLGMNIQWWQILLITLYAGFAFYDGNNTTFEL